MAKYHINTEVLLAIAYAVICVIMLLLASTKFPTTMKKRINGLVHHCLYFLLWGALVPAWVLFSGIRTINTLSQKHATLESSPHLLDKHKGKVLKQQRNIVIGALGLVLFFVLWRVNRIVSSYEGMIRVETPSASPVAGSSNGSSVGSNASTEPSAPLKSSLDVDADTLTKRANVKSANLKKVD